MDLKQLRDQIDSIDEQLVQLFTQRMEIAAQVAEYKRANGLPILNRTREREVLAKVSEGLAAPMDQFTRRLFTELMSMSRTYQSVCMAQPQDEPGAAIRAALQSSPRKLPGTAMVACQGVEGAYSQIACDKLFSGASILFMENFEGVARAVSSGLCQYGVLPIENNIYGSVNAVYDLMQKHSFYIVKSIKLRINHSLVAKPGTKPEDIREIFSHEQAIGQCSEFLKQYPNAKVTPVANTAVAARSVAESPRTDTAAICSADACELYGLEKLFRDIQNSDNNYTRFICIARDLQIFEGCTRVSLMFRAAHKPGALYEVLSHFASIGLNVSKLESRPISGHDFEFQFYLDVEADVRDEQVVRLLCDLPRCTEQLTFLGAYTEA